MRPWYVPLLVLALAGCPLPGGGPPSYVDTSKIVITRAGPDAVSISGQPGTVKPGAATTVTLTIQRPTTASPSPAAYRLQHLGSHLPVASGFAVLEPDGSFKPVTLGDASNLVHAGDELDVTPENGTEQVGYTVFVTIP